jgi:predicted Zn finger-like uncharacterized protein
MRLICPNCGAQYEVSDDVIPEAGRDVQCSNCGQTWFQDASQADPELLDDQDDMVTVEPDIWEDPAANPPQDTSYEDDQDTSYDGLSGNDWLEDDEGSLPKTAGFADKFDDELGGDFGGDFDDTAIPDIIEETTAPTIPPQREMDPEVASILREEADREAQARAADGSGLETQGDLGLVEADPVITKREAEMRERMADIQGIPNADPDGPRRALLPDIEEINSSLSARSPEIETAAHDPYEYEIENRRGFRYGFFLTASLVIFTILVYAYGPQIVEQVPVSGGVIAEFTTYIDKSRVWLDGAVQSFIAKVSAI